MEGADVIFAGSGWSMVEPVDVLAREYPDIKFVIFDDFAKEYLPNVASVTFKQNEGSFLAGAFAALQTTTGRIGVIGGLDIPVINDFIVGYEAGARFINPNIRIYTDFISRHNATSNPFSDPDTAHKIAMEMYGRRDVDIIFGVAGASGFGIFNAASQMGQYAIGVDSDQDYLAEGTILTSMMKRMDKSIEMLAGIILAGRFENKPYMLGLVEECIGLSEMEFTRDKIPTTTLDAINNIKSQIVSGEIVVPTKLIHN
jgi:basic membrane protein A